jgi:hypothetical protein
MRPVLAGEFRPGQKAPAAGKQADSSAGPAVCRARAMG